MGMQALLHVVYPPQCLTCDARVTTDFGLCAACWRDTPFITGLACTKCGIPLPGDDDAVEVFCDDCLTIARPWGQGRAAMLYEGNGRKLVLSFKHGDRIDLARPVARWMARAAAPLIQPGMLVAPVPLHWMRLVKRRYNPAALLSAGIAKITKLDHCPDLLLRRHNTGSQDGLTRDGRFSNMSDALTAHPRRAKQIEGRHILLVDDVMTSGATLAAAAEACIASGATGISVLVMARVAKDA
jgi:predicted amidophosphoribosyltransferase